MGCDTQLQSLKIRGTSALNSKIQIRTFEGLCVCLCCPVRFVPTSFWERLRKFFFGGKNPVRAGESNVRSDNQNVRNLRTQLSNPVGSIQPKVKTHFRRSIGSSAPHPRTGGSVPLLHPLLSRLAGNGSEDVGFFSETLVGTRSRVDPRTLLSNVCWECVFISH